MEKTKKKKQLFIFCAVGGALLMTLGFLFIFNGSAFIANADDSGPGHQAPPEGGVPAEEVEYLSDHIYDDITYNDVFTDKGVVINGLYMDWYIDCIMVKDNPSIGLQSNPYAYIEGNKYYQALIDMGPVAIPQLEDELLEHRVRGLSAYLFAVAIERTAKADILGIIGDPYAISSAGDFLDYWMPVRKTATEDVRTIVLSDSYTTEQKLEKIGYYGLLATEALGELKDDPTLDKDLRAGLAKQLESLGVTDKEQIAYVTQCLAL